jgi:hypothetical protein
MVGERMCANTRDNDEGYSECNAVEFESGCWHSVSWIVGISVFHFVARVALSTIPEALSII